MTRWFPRAALGLTVAAGLTTATPAADEPPTGPAPPLAGKAPPPKVDYSAYVHHSEARAEVVKVDSSSITLRTYFQAATQGKSGGKGGKGGRPKAAQTHTEHKDHVIGLVPESLARVKALPKKPNDESGKSVGYTTAELDELRAPSGAPGYNVALQDVTPGTIVEAFLMRDKKVALKDVKETDLKLKYAIVVGHNPNAAPAAAPAKKK